ncbi:MAG: hypothetical protein V4573_11825 [Pseudomonadota bacterium]
MNLITSALQVLLALSMIFTSVAAAFRLRLLSAWATHLPQTGIARWAVAILTGLAGIATLGGIAVPFVVFFASCLALVASALLLVWMLLSKVKHLRFVPVLMALVAVAVAVAQPLGLKVLALPKADDLAFAPSLSTVVKTYDEGFWLEGIAAGNDGTLYLAGNRGLDFARNDYYRDAQGEVIARRADGNERVVFKTPRGSTAGVVAVANDGTLYLTSHGDKSSLWRLDGQGAGQPLGNFPQGAWPNGLDIGPDGMLYSPDSHLGVIWRVNPSTGQTEEAVKSPVLLARPFIALAPGANGLHFSGRDMYVTVSDKTTVLKYSMDAQGRFGNATVVATGIPGDDFAIGTDGSLFITTHPYNTVVKVASDGKRTVIGKTEQHIVGATDAVFGKTPQDRDTLYVVTDGGAFTGGPTTRGELVALKP